MDDRPSLEASAYRLLEQEHRLSEKRVELVCAADITPQPIAWLWQGYLARGELHLLAGAPGSGKTSLAMELAATISRGGTWPDDSPTAAGEVLIWTGEDSPEHTLVPRLIAAGANRSNIHLIQGVAVGERARAFDPAIDLPLLEVEMRHMPKVSLVILDPIVSAISGDSHKNTEVRRNLQPVVDLAQRADACVLGISHFTKGSAGRDVVERVTGSLAFAAVSRIVLVTASGNGTPDERPRALIRAKSNLGPDGGGFGYSVEALEIAKGISASRIAWQQPLAGSAAELMGIFEGQKPASNADEVAEWLRTFLAGGAKPARDITEFGATLGYTKRMIRRAAERLAVVHERVGFGPGSQLFWRMPGPH